MIIEKIINSYREQEEIRGLYTKYQFDLVTLKKNSKPIKEINDEIRQLAKRLIMSVKISGGLGMAAPQLGVHIRMIAYRKYKDKIEGLINPEIIEKRGVQYIDEGCISFPDIFATVQRPAMVVVKALNLEEKEITINEDGILACVVRHEMDHLDGKIFFENKIIGRLDDRYDYINKLYRPTMKLQKEINIEDNER